MHHFGAFMGRRIARVGFALLLVTAGWKVFHQLVAFEIARLYPTVDGLHEAVGWDPEGADYHFRLGLLYRDDAALQDLERSSSYLEKATELNPHAWWYWLQLARNYELAGLTKQAEAAFRRAVEINPIDAGYRWRFANHYLRERNLEAALTQFEKTIGLEPARYLRSTLLLLWKAGVPVDRILKIWPEDKEARLTLLRFLAQKSSNLLETMDDQWSKLLQEPELPTISEGEFYIRYLIREKRFREAKRDWKRLNGVDGFETLIWNGDFRLQVGDGVLGWRIDRPRVRQVVADHQMEIEFDGSQNINFNGLQQTVVAEPGEEYEFSFRARSEAISTEQGIYFEIVAGTVLLQTEMILATTPWTEYRGTFRLPEDHGLLTVRLRRRPSRRIDNKLQGKLWVDWVKLEPSGQTDRRATVRGPRQ